MSAANNCAMNGLGMDFYLAVDDNGQTDEERSVVSNVLKGYQSTAFVPVQQLEKEGPVFDLVVANILVDLRLICVPGLDGHVHPGRSSDVFPMLLLVAGAYFDPPGADVARAPAARGSRGVERVGGAAGGHRRGPLR